MHVGSQMLMISYLPLPHLVVYRTSLQEALTMWPSFKLWARRNLKREKWVPFHTALSPHELFAVEKIHHNQEIRHDVHDDNHIVGDDSDDGASKLVVMMVVW